MVVNKKKQADLDVEKTPDFRTRAEIRRHLTVNHDYEFKMTSYLLAGHGAGMIACLAALKDYNDIPQLHGIGVFIILFGAGLILSAVAFALLTAAIDADYRFSALYQDEAEAHGYKLHIGYSLVVAGAAISFVTAVGLGMYRFGGL